MPPMRTFSALPSCSSTMVSSASTARLASALLNSALSATELTSWACVKGTDLLLNFDGWADSTLPGGRTGDFLVQTRAAYCADRGRDALRRPHMVSHQTNRCMMSSPTYPCFGGSNASGTLPTV